MVEIFHHGKKNQPSKVILTFYAMAFDILYFGNEKFCTESLCLGFFDYCCFKIKSNFIV